MARRLGQRDITWLSVLAGLFLLLAVLVLYGAQGYDRPFANLFLRVLGIPGTSLGWGSVALVLLAIPYALLAWLRGPIPAKSVSLLGALVFALGVGGLAGALSETPFAGGGRLAGTLAQMLRDVLGTGMSAVLMGAIAVPGLFLAMAPLVIEASKAGVTRSAGGGPSSGGAAGADAPPAPSAGATAIPRGGAAVPAAPVRVAPGRTTPPVPVKAKPWYPERRVAPDGTEVPMQLPGADVGPIRYRDDPAPPPKPSPNAIATAPPAGLKKDKPIAGIRYVDEAPPEAPPKPTALEVPSEDDLPEGVRFAPSTAPASGEPVADAEGPSFPASDLPPLEATFEPPVDASAALPMDALPTPVARTSVAEGPPVVAEPVVAEPLVAPPVVAPPVVALPAAPAATPSPAAGTAPAAEAPSAPSAPAAPAIPGVQVEIPAPSAKAAGALGLDGPALEGTAAAAVAAATAGPEAAGAPPLHPSVAGHRRKLAETGIVGGNPAADRPGRAPKPRPRPTPPTADFREALRGLFSSLPVEELPPMRVSEPLEPEQPPEPRPVPDSPGQLRLFDPGAPEPGERHPGLDDPLFGSSVEAALERGSASLVLLKRKLGVGYARAATLMDALVAEGILGEMTASGSRPTLLTPGEWARRKRS